MKIIKIAQNQQKQPNQQKLEKENITMQNQLPELPQSEKPKKPIIKIMMLEQFINNMQVIKDEGYNVVSIRSSERNSCESHKKLYDQIDSFFVGYPNIFVVIFDDFRKKRKDYYPLEPAKGIYPSATHISSILEWAKNKWTENKKPFIVHCTAGISRSSAIAVLINQMIMGEYKNVFNPQLHSPNPRILELGEKFLGTNHVNDNVREIMLEQRYLDRNNPIF